MTRMMKRLTAVLLAVILAFSLLPLSALANDKGVYFEKDGLLYVGGNGEITIIGCNIFEIDEDIIIPETISYQGRSYTVKSIGNDAFHAYDDSISLKSVTIPASVESIESNAFKNCQNLETVTFAEGSRLTEIESKVFSCCYALKRINIPDSVTAIGEQAFYNCGALRTISLPSGLSSIGDKAFFNTFLSSVTIPASVESIGTEAFTTCGLLDIHTSLLDRTLKNVDYRGSRSEWNTLVSGKDIGIGSAAVYTKATITFDTKGKGTVPVPVAIEPRVAPSSVVGSEGPYVIDGANAVEAWYEDEALTEPFDFDSFLSDDVTVYAKWGDSKYTVTVKTVAGETMNTNQYSFSPVGESSFLPGTNVSISFKQLTGDEIKRVLIDGVRIDEKPTFFLRTFPFTMPHHNAILTAVSKSDLSYPITVQCDPIQGGSVYIRGDESGVSGEKMKINQKPYEGFRFKEWQTSGGVTVEDDGYFTMPANEVSITAVYEPEYTVIWLNGDNSPLASAVYYGDEEEPSIGLIPEKEDKGNYSYTFEEWDEGTVSGHTKIYAPVFSRTLKDIPLWIGDTQVTGDNCGGIPSVTDGSASFDPETNILTLDNVKDIRGEYNDAILVSGLGELTVRMIGNNKFDSFIRNSSSSDYLRRLGISAAGAVRFTDGGSGSLSFTNFEQAIVTNSVLSVESGTVNCAMSGCVFERIDDSNGVIECGDMTLSGGSLSINALCHARGNMMTVSSTVEGSDDTYRLTGIDCSSFTMTDGSLHIRNASTAVSASAHARIEGGQVNITDTRSVGIYGPQITFSGTDTDVSISAVNYTVYAASALTLSEEVAILSPEGAYTGSGTIWNAGGTRATDVHIATKMHTIVIDLGDVGEDITVQVKHGTNFFDALDAQDVFTMLYAMENDDLLFRDLATKPLSEFADEEEYSADAEALLKTEVTSDMTVYTGFYTKIKTVSLTLEQPVVGSTVSVDDEYSQSPAPEITLLDDAHCSVSEGSAVWSVTDSEGGSSIFSGTFAKGKTYYAELLLVPDFGYWLDDDTVVTANGAKVEESYGRMALYVLLSTQASSPALLGDADGSGAVDVIDATIIQRYLTNMPVSYPLETLMNGDVDGDGALSVVDVTFIQRFCAHIPTPYSIGG